jgi:hypothetical protein
MGSFNKQIILANYQVFHVTSIVFTPSLPANGYSESGIITISVSSADAEIKKPYKPTYLILNN